MKRLVFALGLLSSIAMAQEVQNIPDVETEVVDEEDDQNLPLAEDEDFGDEDVSFRKFVGIPKGYVYKPSLGTTHDYCSYSPDKYGKADFRGPCARHDMCYDSPTDKKKCDVNLMKDMYSNCNSAYGALNPLRVTCYTNANHYFAAVVVHH